MKKKSPCILVLPLWLQVTTPKEELISWQSRPMEIVARFLLLFNQQISFESLPITFQLKISCKVINGRCLCDKLSFTFQQEISFKVQNYRRVGHLLFN